MTVRLLHFSDIHFGGENREALAAATAYARATPFDLLIVTGDLTQFGARREFDLATAWFDQAPSPWIALPGNHDTPWLGLPARVLNPFGRYERSVGPADDGGFDAPGLVVRTFNSARGWQVRLNWSKGAVSRAQARRTAAELAAAPPDALRVAACHHPLTEHPGEPITSRVRGGAWAARRLARAHADIILTGHLHTPFVDALPFEDGRTYAVGAGTLSRRERGCPAGFNVLEIADGQLTVTALGWSDGALGPQQVWSAPLRARPMAPA